MQIIVIDPTYTNNTDHDQFVKKLKREFSTISKDIKVKTTDIGYGASWPAIEIVFPVLIFFSGKKVNENIDAWLSIARKLISLMKKFRTYIDDEGAALLVIKDIASSQKIKEIKRISTEIIPVAPFEGRKKDSLDSRPNALYIQIYKVNNEFVYVYGIKSNGKMEIKYRINIEDFMRFEQSEKP